MHVLTSVDYSKMSDEDKAKEPAATARTDHDYALSYIRREGQGRVFYEAHGHNEKVYAIKPMLEHMLAGIQYAARRPQGGRQPERESWAGSGQVGRRRSSRAQGARWSTEPAPMTA